MKPLGKAGIVAAGYAAAFALAFGVTYLRMMAYENDPIAQASSGMYAFGDALLFVFTFGVAALPPTGLALYFLRPVQRFWNVIAVGALLFASTGVVAALVHWAERLQPQWASVLTWWPAFAILRMIIAPLVTAVFIVCAMFAPEQRPRRLLIIAAVCEGAAAAPWLLSLVMMLLSSR
jgi:hypothetical protein